MVRVAALEQTVSVVNRVVVLPRELYKNMHSRVTGMIGGTVYDNDVMTEQRQTYLMSVISDFKRYPSLKSELTTEVSANLLANLRPAEESNYLARLVDILALIDRTYQQSEGQSWEDDILIRINPTFAGTPTESEVAAQALEESLFVELIETVRDCCHELNTECVAIAEIVRRFPYVRQNPARFPTISSLTETNEPTPIPATEQTERAMNESESAPTSTGQQSQSTEPDKDTDLNVKILIAEQSGILTGDFHKLPIEKQYAILAVLFGRSKANVKNALTALTGNANNTKNPRNLPQVVDKANDLITSLDLGLSLIKNR